MFFPPMKWKTLRHSSPILRGVPILGSKEPGQAATHRDSQVIRNTAPDSPRYLCRENGSTHSVGSRPLSPARLIPQRVLNTAAKRFASESMATKRWGSPQVPMSQARPSQETQFASKPYAWRSPPVSFSNNTERQPSLSQDEVAVTSISSRKPGPSVNYTMRRIVNPNAASISTTHRPSTSTTFTASDCISQPASPAAGSLPYKNHAPSLSVHRSDESSDNRGTLRGVYRACMDLQSNPFEDIGKLDSSAPLDIDKLQNIDAEPIPDRNGVESPTSAHEWSPLTRGMAVLDRVREFCPDSHAENGVHKHSSEAKDAYDTYVAVNHTATCGADSSEYPPGPSEAAGYSNVARAPALRRTDPSPKRLMHARRSQYTPTASDTIEPAAQQNPDPRNAECRSPATSLAATPECAHPAAPAVSPQQGNSRRQGADVPLKPPVPQAHSPRNRHREPENPLARAGRAKSPLPHACSRDGASRRSISPSLRTSARTPIRRNTASRSVTPDTGRLARETAASRNRQRVPTRQPQFPTSRRSSAPPTEYSVPYVAAEYNQVELPQDQCHSHIGSDDHFQSAIFRVGEQQGVESLNSQLWEIGAGALPPVQNVYEPSSAASTPHIFPSILLPRHTQMKCANPGYSVPSGTQSERESATCTPRLPPGGFSADMQVPPSGPAVGRAQDPTYAPAGAQLYPRYSAAGRGPSYQVPYEQERYGQPADRAGRLADEASLTRDPPAQPADQQAADHFFAPGCQLPRDAAQGQGAAGLLHPSGQQVRGADRQHSLGRAPHPNDTQFQIANQQQGLSRAPYASDPQFLVPAQQQGIGQTSYPSDAQFHPAGQLQGIDQPSHPSGQHSQYADLQQGQAYPSYPSDPHFQVPNQQPRMGQSSYPSDAQFHPAGKLQGIDQPPHPSGQHPQYVDLQQRQAYPSYPSDPQFLVPDQRPGMGQSSYPRAAPCHPAGKLQRIAQPAHSSDPQFPAHGQQTTAHIAQQLADRHRVESIYDARQQLPTQDLSDRPHGGSQFLESVSRNQQSARNDMEIGCDINPRTNGTYETDSSRPDWQSDDAEFLLCEEWANNHTDFLERAKLQNAHNAQAKNSIRPPKAVQKQRCQNRPPSVPRLPLQTALPGELSDHVDMYLTADSFASQASSSIDSYDPQPCGIQSPNSIAAVHDRAKLELAAFDLHAYRSGIAAFENNPPACLKTFCETLQMLLDTPNKRYDADLAADLPISFLHGQFNAARISRLQYRRLVQTLNTVSHKLSESFAPVVPLSRYFMVLAQHVHHKWPQEAIPEEPPELSSRFLITPDLRQMTDSQKAHVEGLVIVRPEVGEIKFHEPVDARKMEFDRDIIMEIGEVVLYPDEERKPPPGEGLNRPCRITLFNCLADPNMDEHRRTRFLQKIRSMTEAKGATFLSYNLQNGIWRFDVDRF